MTVTARDHQRLAEIEARAKHVVTGAPYRVVQDHGGKRQCWVLARDGDVLATIANLIGTGDGIDAKAAAEFYANAPADVLALLAIVQAPPEGTEAAAGIRFAAGVAEHAAGSVLLEGRELAVWKAACETIALGLRATASTALAPRAGDRYVATVTVRAATAGALIEALRVAWLDVLGSSLPLERAGGNADAHTEIVVKRTEIER